MTLTALFVVSGAQPEVFGFVAVESITSPPDESGEVAWATSDAMPQSPSGPPQYDAAMIRSLFGEPRAVAPDVEGWAFAHRDAPAFGLVLVPIPNGQVRPLRWTWGTVPPAESFRGMRVTRQAGSAWLNALADFQREVLHEPSR